MIFSLIFALFFATYVLSVVIMLLAYVRSTWVSGRQPEAKVQIAMAIFCPFVNLVCAIEQGVRLVRWALGLEARP